MLNVDACRNEIYDLLDKTKPTTICDAVFDSEKDFPILSKKLNMICGEISQVEDEPCSVCKRKLIDWLLKEHKQSDIDWQSVPVNTLVWVWDEECERKVIRCLSHVKNDEFYCFLDGKHGRTGEQVKAWKYCELAVEVDEIKYRKVK